MTTMTIDPPIDPHQGHAAAAAAAAAAALSLLLKLFWILTTASVLITITPFPAPKAFKDAVRLSAARGKLWSEKPKALGPLGDTSVPQAWFSHFYAVGAACNALLLRAVYCHCPGAGNQVLPLLMLQLHLSRRLLETLFLMTYPPHALMHVIAYAFGLVYYVVLPLSLLDNRSLLRLASVPLTHLLTGSSSSSSSSGPHLQQEGLGAMGLDLGSALTPRSTAVVMGLVVFLGGNALQLWAHASLAGLSRSAPAASAPGAKAPRAAPLAQGGTASAAAGASPGGAPGSALSRRAAAAPGAGHGPAPGPEAGPGSRPGVGCYALPQGGVFDWVSCPHYLGEIVVYVGLLLLSGGLMNMWLALAWVTVNLVLAADATQRWYRAAFTHYPPHRKALLPYIW